MTQPAEVHTSLFVTCIVDQLYPQVGVSVVNVLRRHGVKLDFPSDQTCCGQPLFNSGYTQLARQLGKRVIDSFSLSDYVVVPSGSCAAMLKVFYRELFSGDPDYGEKAEQLAGKVFEFSEFLVKVLGIEDAGACFPATATYHSSCHLLREMEVRQEPLLLLEKVEGLELRPLPQAETCCGFGGTFSVKYPHISEGMMEDKIANVLATGADTLISCDMSCLMHIGGGMSRQGQPVRVRHIAEILEGQEETGGAGNG
ncbi:MAG: (Fe-S)-binding protein [Chloroflexota bacterium]|nr:(Fe-S)-binding protein [Chloroflexota bacterium]